MALFVYITEECLKDAKHHQYEEEINRLKERIEKEQRTTLFDNYPPPYLIKRFTRQMRLIAAEIAYHDVVVVCFYRLLVRGSKNYEAFLNKPEQYGDENFLPLISDKGLQKWLKEKLRKDTPPAKPKPDKYERKFLWDVITPDKPAGQEVIVCESADWVDMVNKKSLKQKLIVLVDTILSIHDNVTTAIYQIPIEGRKGWFLLARYFSKHNKLLLIAPLIEQNEIDQNEIEIKRLHKKYSEILEADEDSITDDYILKFSIRAYPIEILLDEDIWLAVQQDEAANLSFSPEESRILKSVHLWSDDCKKGYPLFINGRAGSGKTTILQYLYADYLQLYILNKEKGRKCPLYLTYGSELLKRSIMNLEGILRCNSRYAKKYNNIDISELEDFPDVRDCFQEFHSFLYNMLTENERNIHLKRNNYVNYSKFKALWSDKFSYDKNAGKEYPPSLAWHVIRTYIKGLSLDDFLDPEEYKEIPVKEKTVTASTFEKIFNRVWKNWYSEICTDNGYWDDQDLTRYILSKDRIKPEYPVIFCDESQDFTRIELEAILRMFVFSDRQLDSGELKRVPLAFAGDPFQTLTPTGFRWEAIKSSFVLQFVHALDPLQRSNRADLNYRELSFNYRSTKNIVKLCNSIQALRSSLFNIKSISPQETWQLEFTSPMPVWFNRGDSDIIERLKKETDITIIIPCDEGEEIDFVKHNKYLMSFVTTDETGVPQNVLSAMRAKGLEFNRVILYGFGEECPEYLLEPVYNGFSSDIDPDSALPKEYFINRLYVAASRAKKRLFIIDSTEGMERLWKFATDESAQESIIKHLKTSGSDWEENMGMLDPGIEESLMEDKEGIGLVAERFEKEGRTTKDPYLLRNAAMLYKSINIDTEAQKCKAYSLLFEGKYEKAGDLFKKNEDYNQAAEAYWAGENYGDICNIGQNHLTSDRKLKYRFAGFIKNNGTVSQAKSLVVELISLNINEISGEQFSLWNSAASSVIELISKKIPSYDIDFHDLMDINISLEELVNCGFVFKNSILARIHYLLGDMSEAVELWEKDEIISDPLYKEAKTKVLVNAYENEQLEEITDKNINYLLDYYLNNNNEKAFSIIKSYGGLKQAKKFFNIIAKEDNNNNFLLKAIGLLIEKMIKTGKWEEVISLLKDEKVSSLGISEKIKKYPEIIRHTATSVLAESEFLLSEKDRRYKMIFSNLLKDWYISSRLGWSDYISPEAVGSALERTGRDIDCLQFYENIIAAPGFDDKQKYRAKIRWTKCKIKQADREEKDHVSKKYKKQAEEKTALWGIKKIDDVPYYPDISDYVSYVSHKVEMSSKPVSADTIKLSELTIKNFRGFRELSVKFPPDSAVLVGINGSGKSSILDCIAIFLSHFIIKLTKNTGKLKADFELTDNDVNIHSKERAELSFTVSTDKHNTVKWDIRKMNSPSEPTEDDIELNKYIDSVNNILINSEPDLNFPVLAYYQTNRIILKSGASSKSKDQRHEFPQFMAYDNAFSKNMTNFLNFLEWFRYEEDIENEIKIRERNFNAVTKNLENVRRAIENFLNWFPSDNFSDLQVKRETERQDYSFQPLKESSLLITKNKNDKLDIEQLSSGEQILLIMIADIARRLTIANPRLKNALHGSGIVLIDEIELHMHPQWQREIIPCLRKTFPKIQFIVTTHSPQVLSSIDKENLIMLEDFQIVKEIPYTKGRDANSILFDIQGVEKRPLEYKSKINELYGLLDVENVEEAKKMLNELTEKFGENDSEIVRINTHIAYLERMES
ncbi:MAG: AAA family ATPase [Desulfobacteraceae bacterium]|nr:AAA family ATPase [Desulfobacteraceae bacterium]